MKPIQEKVRKLSKSKGYDRETLEQTMLLLTEEVGELAKAVRKHAGMKIGTHSQDPKAGEEVADVLYVLVDICNKLGIDIEKEFKKKFKIIKGR